MKFKYYIQSIQGIDIYPIFSLLVFFIFFVLVGLIAWKMNKEYANSMSMIPLDNDNLHNNKVKSEL